MSKYQDPKNPFIPDRNAIPLHEPKYAPITEKFIADAPPPPPRFTVKPPEGAPNILICLIDDMGYGASSAFGGPVPMPNAERMAKRGMRFNRFHTTSICAPTRAALLSGYNHHSANMGQITEVGTAYPGNLCTRPKDVTPVARILKDNGYNTAQFGKCHEAPNWETSPVGPFDHWPTYSGFEKFYGFMAAETSQIHPELFDGTTMLDTPEDPDYHLSEDLADQCCLWMQTQKALAPDKPFFTYFAPGATHVPHQVPQKYIDMFKGQFDEGWDAVRAKTHQNMLDMGIIPPGTDLAAKPKAIVDWDTLPEKEKELYRLQMEIYAGYGYHIDEQIGKIFDTMEDLGILDNTLVFYILGDNGASAEGHMHGVFNEMSSANGHEEDVDWIIEHKDWLGNDMSYGHYAAGWAIALDSPFTWAKQIASNFGGTRNGMIVHYPAKYEGKGECHDQFHHVIDVAPTILDIAGIPQPEYVDGIKQRPVEGVSMKYAMEDKDAKGTRDTQYFCIDANMGIYHEGWFAGALDKAPWESKSGIKSLDDSVWELYDLSRDFSCANDLAKEMPEKVEEMKKVFFAEAEKFNVLPIDNRGILRFNAALVGRPTLMGDRKEIKLTEGMVGLKENCFLNTKNTSFKITADVEVGDGHSDGVILSMGGRYGGFVLYVKDKIPVFCFNYLGFDRYYTRGEALTCERNQIIADFQYDGGGLGKGGNVVLTVNNKEVGTGRVDQTMPLIIAVDESASVGLQRGTPVTEEYTAKDSKFKGKIFGVDVQIYD